MKSSKLPLALVAALVIVVIYYLRADEIAGMPEHSLYLVLVSVLVAYGLWWLVTSRVDPEKPVSRMPRGVKVGLACFSLSWGLMCMMALVLLPFAGPVSLRVLVGPWSPILWIVGAFMLVPFIQKRLQ
ncbi:MAG: hypothetical protein ABW072_13465 [Sedimenticola sp.]